MEVLSVIGMYLFIFLVILDIVVNFFEPKWYWEDFIPKLHQKEEKHPIITGIVLLLLVIIMMIGLMSAIM